MSDAVAKKPRPKHLNLMVIRQPLPAIISILHRVSGAGLFLLLPLLLWFFSASFNDPYTASAIFGHPLVKLVLFGLLWAFLHHFCAGIRFLLMDVHKGVELRKARASAWAVLAVSLPLTALIGAKLFLG
ncbi:succinate dehydrogenase, cytochrome b556 subunit [Niveibacterium sp. SC-1]|uniref:succinate dehydrogenase, cytochrome b556 subunit n=1 Tax=Niveibacterium sp. SC-1 TaxID=3135646 RepID=UPI00311F0EB6